MKQPETRWIAGKLRWMDRLFLSGRFPSP